MRLHIRENMGVAHAGSVDQIAASGRLGVDKAVVTVSIAEYENIVVGSAHTVASAIKEALEIRTDSRRLACCFSSEAADDPEVRKDKPGPVP
jgi:hypothetical protein